jgi:hypothetical protein
MCRHCLRLNLAALHSLSVRWLPGLRSWLAFELGTSELISVGASHSCVNILFDIR